MPQLSTEQLLYLFYAFAYSDGDSVTKSVVKSHLSTDAQKNAESICDFLCQQQLIESPKKGRLVVTENGTKALVANLLTTDYKFDSTKGPKVVNSLLDCLKMASSEIQLSSLPVEEMGFNTFVEKFKALYFEERRRQELRGVVVIRSKEICQKFIEDNPISQSQLDKYFQQLKSNGLVFAVIEKDEELIQWVE